MSFDGIFLSKIKNEIDFLKTGRISKITESGDTDFVLTIRVERQNHNLMMSFSSEYSRIHLTERLYDSVQNPKSFTMFLRKHIEGFFIEDITQYESDRILVFKLAGYNEMQDLCRKYFICEIMGRYSNMILTDEEFKIIEALKHDGVGEYNRTILPGALYEFPKNEKINPLSMSKEDFINTAEKAKNPKELTQLFNGLSLMLATYAFKDDRVGLNLYEAIHSEPKPSVIINEKGKTDFYYLPLNYEVKKEYETISRLLDDYYYRDDLKAKVKLKTDDLLAFVTKQIKKMESKLSKLNQELTESLDSDYLRVNGELLLSYRDLKAKEKNVTVFNYYTGKDQVISLDNKITVLDNSNKYFKKYQKAKSSVKFIAEQQEITKNEIEYFTLLKYQLEDASINEALEIQEELIAGKYLFKKESGPKKKKDKMKLLTYETSEGTLISVGKNNIQNDYLTHKFAKSNEMWFHVKGAPGSHVVIHKGEELTEEDIRTAAMLAAYYSTFKESSSVPVDYTKIRNIKKIPGRKGCFVTYTHQSTIYIDPDVDMVNALKVKKW